MCFLTFYMIMCTLMYYIAFFHMNQGGFCIGYLKVVFHNILQRLSANTIHRIKKGLLITTKTLYKFNFSFRSKATISARSATDNNPIRCVTTHLWTRWVFAPLRSVQSNGPPDHLNPWTDYGASHLFSCKNNY